MDQRPLTADGLPTGYAFNPAWEVTPRAVKAMLDAGDTFTLLDVRTPTEVDAAAIDAARVIPMQELSERLAELEPLKHTKVVVSCHLGGRSLRVTQMLRAQGFTDVTSMAGGIDLWSRDIDPSVPRY